MKDYSIKEAAIMADVSQMTIRRAIKENPNHNGIIYKRGICYITNQFMIDELNKDIENDRKVNMTEYKRMEKENKKLRRDKDEMQQAMTKLILKGSHLDDLFSKAKELGLTGKELRAFLGQ